MTISAVLLAGGKSRRMGEDKATVLFQDMPLWEIQLDLLRKLQPDELFISAQTDPPWRPSDCEFVADGQPSRGPLSGIAASLARTMAEHLLALGTGRRLRLPEGREVTAQVHDGLPIRFRHRSEATVAPLLRYGQVAGFKASA